MPVLAIVVLVAVVVVGAALLDRICASLAERRATELLSAPFGHPATVRVLGPLFLTQSLRGRYREVEVAGNGLRLGEISGIAVVARLTNVHLPTLEVLRKRTSELPCERVEGTVMLAYSELARVTRVPGLSLYYQDSAADGAGGRLMASVSLPMPGGLGQVAQVNGEAVLARAGAGTVALRIHGVSVAGMTLPGIVLNPVLRTLTVPIPLPALPFGLRIDELRPTETGLHVLGSAEAVTFRKSAYALTGRLAPPRA